MALSRDRAVFSICRRARTRFFYLQAGANPVFSICERVRTRLQLQAPEQGQFVAWTMLIVPYEILAAFDVIPSYFENYGPVCAAKQVGDQYCEVAEGDGFSTDQCPYLRIGLGYAKMSRDSGGEPPPEAPYGGAGKPNMLIGLHAFCDGRLKWLQQVGRYLDVPYLALDFKGWPEGWDQNDPYLKQHMVSYHLEQLRELVAFLERVLNPQFLPSTYC